ncbi:hypothetical protein PR202_ga08402 [Eleusine coracana subsp. coracana]|uniref:Uncharacterized protein n=1 Tax=Eleusine coracana subsp. coracana TaxID=191504 RepID=A0AAV5BZX7_ELECO|nr:hypothetical protein PR202_ga08402 [Eleusine coracana subsp. coracana]
MLISSEDLGNMDIARIQPLTAHLQHPCPTPPDPEKKQVYTVWMKSLVFNGHGCTIYGHDGHVAYRVDNYACSRSREVYVMDSCGKTLIKLLKKNFGVFKTWKGYAYCNGIGGLEEEATKPWCTRSMAPHKSEYRISDADGKVMAEMKRKHTASGLVLGEDVLTLTVGQSENLLLVVGLVVVCGLLSRCI